jgi:hypothetical protein
MSRARFLQLQGTACLFTLGLLLNLLACMIEFDKDVPPNAYPLISYVFYVITPMPRILFERMRKRRNSVAYMFVGIGDFLVGSLAVSGLAFPLMLAHGAVVSWGAAVLSVLGGLVVYGAVLKY